MVVERVVEENACSHSANVDLNTHETYHREKYLTRAEVVLVAGEGFESGRMGRYTDCRTRRLFGLSAGHKPRGHMPDAHTEVCHMRLERLYHMTEDCMWHDIGQDYRTTAPPWIVTAAATGNVDILPADSVFGKVGLLAPHM